MGRWRGSKQGANCVIDRCDNVLGPYRVSIYDNAACRLGKETHFVVFVNLVLANDIIL